MKISKRKHVDPSWGYLELDGGSIVAIPKKAMKELQAEIKQLKKEVADYHQLQWQHDALIDETEKLNRELKQTEVQDQVVIDKLRKENARLIYALARLRWKYALDMETMTDQLYTERPSCWKFYHKSKTYWFRKWKKLKKELKEEGK